MVEHAKRKKMPGLAARTKHKHFEKLRAFFNACVDEGLLAKSPTDALPLQRKSVVQQAAKGPFTNQEMALIFGPEWAEWGRVKKHRKWGVLLGLFSGARVNEIAQLRVNDIEEVSGLWGFHVRAAHPNQRVKNKSSRRFVPLPQRLIDLGFLDYVAEQKQDGQLFPLLPYCPINGYGDALSDQFSRYLKKLGVKGSAGRVGFHCWRHTFISRCSTEVGLNETLISTVTGHALSGPGAMAEYLKKGTLEQAKKVVEAHADLYTSTEF